MTDSPPRRGSGARLLRAAGCCAALAAVVCLPSHWRRDLWNPDEPRYMEVAREMVALDDYFVLHLNGARYSQKPPLFFWLTAGLYRLGAGFNAGRLVSAGATFGTLTAVYLLARGSIGDLGGLLAALVTSTLTLFTLMSKSGVIDPLLTFLATSALACGYRALHGERRRADLWWLACYLACGLGILAKGPIALVLPGLVLGLYWVTNRRRLRLAIWPHGVGLALAAGVVAIWVVPLAVRTEWDYARRILLWQSTSRLASSWSHRHGPFYYLVGLPWYALPWTAFVALAVAWSVAWWRRETALARLGVVWFLGVLVVMSAVSGKRARYLAPLLPSAGILASCYLLACWRSGPPWPRLHRWLSVVTFALICLLGVVVGAMAVAAPALAARSGRFEAETVSRLREVLSGGTVALVTGFGCGVVAIGAIGLWRSLRGGGRGHPVAELAGAALALSLFFDLAVCPVGNGFKSGRYFAEAALPYLGRAEARLMFPQAFSGVYNLYSGMTSMPVARKWEDAQDELASARRVALITERRCLDGLRTPLPPGVEAVLERRVGHRRMVLLANRPLRESVSRPMGE